MTKIRIYPKYAKNGLQDVVDRTRHLFAEMGAWPPCRAAAPHLHAACLCIPTTPSHVLEKPESAPHSSLSLAYALALLSSAAMVSAFAVQAKLPAAA